MTNCVIFASEWMKLKQSLWGGRRRCDRMEVGFTTTFVINAYHHYKVVISSLVHGEVYSIQHYVIKFVNYLRHVGGFL